MGFRRPGVFQGLCFESCFLSSISAGPFCREKLAGCEPQGACLSCFVCWLSISDDFCRTHALWLCRCIFQESCDAGANKKLLLTCVACIFHSSFAPGPVLALRL